MNNEILAEIFGRKDATEGAGSNMMIEDDTIYSQGKHYKIAVRLNPDQKFATGVSHIYNPDFYSKSTCKHQAYVRRNLQSYIAIPDCNIEEQTLRNYVNELRLEIDTVKDKQSKLKAKGKRFYQFESKISTMTDSMNAVNNFTVSLYGSQAIDFIKKAS